MTTTDRERIATIAPQIGNPLRVQRFCATEDEGGAMAAFADTLAAMVPAIDLRRETLAAGQMPYLQIGDSLRCAWVPKGDKLSLLLRALVWASDPTAAPAPPVDRPALPAAIRLYLADACPHCQQVLEMLLPLAFVDPQIRLTLIDAQSHATQAERDAVRSVPTTILDDFRWTGRFPLEELLRLIDERSPASLGPAAMEMMLADGQAAELAEMMRAHERIFPAFYEVVCHPLWSVRLGALVVAETLAETAPRLASTMAQPLWERFPDLEAAAKGDLIYLLGEIQAVDLREALSALYENETDPELRDALTETLEKLT